MANRFRCIKTNLYKHKTRKDFYLHFDSPVNVKKSWTDCLAALVSKACTKTCTRQRRL